MRRIFFTLCVLLCCAVAVAQEEGDGMKKGQFDPKDFEQSLEQYVVEEAGLTKAEEEKFLPIYQEMRVKQVQAMKEERKSRESNPTTEAECEELIKQCDCSEIELKKIVQTYHNKMLAVIPASKLLKVIQAESDFHRDSFRQHIGNAPHPQAKK